MPKRKIKPIGTIKQELKACKDAFKKYPNAKFVWCCHHTRLNERLFTHWMSWQQRINYILTNKPRYQRAIRFRNFRPVIGRGRTRASFNREWPNNTWDGYSIGV